MIDVICLPACHQWRRSQGCSTQVVQTTPQVHSCSSTLPPTASIRYYLPATRKKVESSSHLLWQTVKYLPCDLGLHKNFVTQGARTGRNCLVLFIPVKLGASWHSNKSFIFNYQLDSRCGILSDRYWGSVVTWYQCTQLWPSFWPVGGRCPPSWSQGELQTWVRWWAKACSPTKSTCLCIFCTSHSGKLSGSNMKLSGKVIFFLASEKTDCG